MLAIPRTRYEDRAAMTSSIPEISASNPPFRARDSTASASMTRPRS